MRTPINEDGTMDPVPRLVEEATAALRGHLYTVSIMSALALVDICGALNSNNGRATSDHFKAWWEANLPADVTVLDGVDAWELRNGLLHQGHLRGKTYKYLGIALPRPDGPIIIDSLFRETEDDPGVLVLNSEQFVTAILDAVSAWWEANRSRDPVAGNAQKLARVRTRGMRPIGDIPMLG